MTVTSAALYAGSLFLAASLGWLLLGRLLAGEADEETRWDVAAAFALPLGLVVAALPGWLLSAAFRVPIDALALPLGGALLAALVVLLRKSAPRRPEKLVEALLPFALLAGLFALFLALRFWPGDVRQTEKPMDFAVLTALLTTPSLPLQDPWFAGERFPYYHFGTALLAFPLRVARFAPEYGYNLLCSLVAAMAGAGAFGAVRARGGGRRLAVLAALLLVLAGTPDGARQLLTGKAIAEIDFWASSRRVADTITEWPLFTLHLGDLHPHAVAMPLLVLLAGLAGRLKGARGVALDALLLAALVSANPWDLPAALLLLAGGNLVALRLLPAALRSGLTVAAAIPLLVPFLLSPRPEFQGLRAVAGKTTAPEALFHFGSLALVPALAVGIALVRAGRKADESLFLATAFPAAAFAVVAVTHRPVLGLAVGFLLAVAFLRTRTEGALLGGFLIAAAAAALVAVPELLAVRDPYGEQFHRMNTVFKCYGGAAVLLSIATPLLLPLPLSSRRFRLPIRALLAAGLAATFAHPLSIAVQRWRSPEGTLDGLAWMAREAPGDRKAVDWLRANAPRDAVLLEAVGGAYTDHGRFGSASGRPTVLGWAGHEGLWRGAAGQGEVDRRQQEIKTVYTSTDPAAVRAILARHKVRYVAVGTLEVNEFGAGAFPLGATFKRAFLSDGTALYEVSGS